MSYDNICFETEPQLAVVTLNRPNRRNALSLELMLELLDCLERIRLDSELRPSFWPLRERPSVPAMI